MLVDNLHLGHEPLDADKVVRELGQEELARQLNLGRGTRKVGQEPTLLLDEKGARQGLGLGLEDLDPLFELLDEVLQLGGARQAEVKVGAELGLHTLEDRVLKGGLKDLRII